RQNTKYTFSYNSYIPLLVTQPQPAILNASTSSFSLLGSRSPLANSPASPQAQLATQPRRQARRLAHWPFSVACSLLHFVSRPLSSSLSARPRPRPSSLSSVSDSLASSLLTCPLTSSLTSPTVLFDHQLGLSRSRALCLDVSLCETQTQLTELSFSLAHSFIVKVLSVSRTVSVVFSLAKSSLGDSDSRFPLFTHLDRIINIQNRGIYLLL
ncbi:hypothetical protein PanWU01x14_237400, partial [Parasponia andersonii]